MRRVSEQTKNGEGVEKGKRNNKNKQNNIGEGVEKGRRTNKTTLERGLRRGGANKNKS